MAASTFDRALSLVLQHEGGYVDHPADPGGATNLGITLKTLARHRGGPVSKADLRSLTRREAAAIYRRRYWDAVAGDELPPGLDYCVFDYGVNSGPARAVKSLQRALGIEADGVVGPKTLAALAEVAAAAAIAAVCRERLAFLRRRAAWPVFGKGWERRVKAVEGAARSMAGAALAQAPPSASVPPVARQAAPRSSAARRVPRPAGPSPTPTPERRPAMNGFKTMLQSRTVWANLIGLVALTPVGSKIIGGADVGQTAEAVSTIVSALSFLASTLFRVQATKQIATVSGS